MNSSIIRTPPWATAAFSHSTEPSPLEMSALGSHIDRCIGSRGRLFKLQCAIDAVHDVVASRIVTTVVVVVTVLGISALVL